MSDHVQAHVSNGTGHIVLDRPKARNSVSLDMVRALTAHAACMARRSAR